ncbi:MAG: M81 family metallopeptidase [Rhodospirillales bacterium]|nr:M81 family metallopeptidase [Rhodospirillales bacterium]
MRVAVAGFIHETNTFSPRPATMERFAEADGWPPLVTGSELPPALAGSNLPAAGFLEAARLDGAEVLPLLWCSAVPSGPVTREAHDAILTRMLERLRAAGPVDAVYLDLHGAMVAEHERDGDGAVLAAVRAEVDASTAVVASLDLHANVSGAMLDASDALVAFRTYPHVDMAATGRRTYAVLKAVLPGIRDGRQPAKALGRSPFLVPLVCQSTDAEPGRRLYARLGDREGPSVYTTSLAMGFPPADTWETGPSVFSYAETEPAARQAVAAVMRRLEAVEPEFAVTLYPPRSAVDEALRIARRAGGPVVVADTRDNPGAGGAGDTTALLSAAVASDADGVAVGVLADPDTAARAAAAGIGAEITVSLGGRSDGRPYVGAARVTALGDGRFTATGPMFGGSRMDLGPMAALRCGRVAVAVASRRMQAADRSMFRHVGIEPDAQRVVIVKSSVHFRADFAHARAVVVADAPGLNPVNHDTLDYRHLRSSVRRMPVVHASGAPG